MIENRRHIHMNIIIHKSILNERHGVVPSENGSIAISITGFNFTTKRLSMQVCMSELMPINDL